MESIAMNRFFYFFAFSDSADICYVLPLEVHAASLSLAEGYISSLHAALEIKFKNIVYAMNPHPLIPGSASQTSANAYYQKLGGKGAPTELIPPQGTNSWVGAFWQPQQTQKNWLYIRAWDNPLSMPVPSAVYL